MSIATIQRIQAVISRFGKIQQSQYPPYARVQSVLFTWQNGTNTQEIWKTYPADEAKLLKVGQPAFLSSRTGRNNQVVWEVEFCKASTPQSSAQPQVSANSDRSLAQHPKPLPIDPPQNQEIALWVENQAELYAQCFDAAWRALAAREVSEETVRAAASTLFISASRKFNLER